MEPRARAGKNVGKETFPSKDIQALLFAFGDVHKPLPETVRVMDEITTEFLEGVCFEASRHATAAGRQKLKFDDFEFALRRNPEYLGKIRTSFDKRVELKNARKAFESDDAAMKTYGKDATASFATDGVDEELGDVDDDAEVLETVRNAGSKKSKKRGNAA